MMKRRLTAGLLAAALAALAIVPATTAAGVVGWGKDQNGQLAAGFLRGRSTPVGAKLLAGRQVVEAQSAYNSSYVLLADGTVFDWGGNNWNQLGLGHHSPAVLTPTLIPTLNAVVQIAQAGAHGMALRADGTVWTWGGNSEGQAGIGVPGEGLESRNIPSPVRVGGLPGPAVKIAAGGSDDAAILADGSLCVWGEGKTGQLATGDKLERSSPFCRNVGAVREVAFGGLPTKGGQLQVLLQNGTVLASGVNGAGQLGTGQPAALTTHLAPVQISGVVQVAPGIEHTLYLTADGSVYATGKNTYGELGIPGVEGSRVPVPVPGLHAVSRIAAGFRFSLALVDGNVLAWGENKVWQTGLSTGNVTVPTANGVTAATAIQAGDYGGFALTNVEPSPPLEAIGGQGTVALRWTVSGTSKWTIGTKIAGAATFTKAASLPSTARSYTVTGLAPGSYTVRIQASSAGVLEARVTVY